MMGNQNRKTHGHTEGRKYSPTYHSWQAMLTRCHNGKHSGAKKYKDRGICVCDSWFVFENFLRDMGDRPNGTSLERKDNSLGYTKENCTWATPQEQARNRRATKLTYHAAFEIWCQMHSGKTAKSIAKEFSISESMPRAIYSGVTWKDAGKEAKEFMNTRTQTNQPDKAI